MTKEAYHFSGIIIDPAGRRVLRDGADLGLEPRAYQVLLYLVERPGEAVSKEDIFRDVWSGSFVSDNALTRVVAQLRKSLGDDPKQPRFIETLPTLGYRFIAPVERVEMEEAGARGGWRVPGWTKIAIAVVISAGATVFLLRSYSFRQPEVATVQLTNSGGLDISPSFSPDGSAFAYSSDISGRFEIYVRSLTGGGRDIALTGDGRQNLQPAWSPDGKWIAYNSVAGGGIFVVPALGGKPRRLTDYGSRPGWSPTSDWVIFRTDPVTALAITEFFPAAESALSRVHIEGGKPLPVTRLKQLPCRPASSAWSPDGKRILFTCLNDLKGSQLWSIAVDGSDPVQAGGQGRIYVSAVYAPDGRSIFYSDLTLAGDFRIWRHWIDASGRRTQGKPTEVARTGLALPRDLAVSRDGKRLAYSLTTMSSNLWSLALADGSAQPLTNNTNFRNTHPVFSPDGTKLVFFARRLGFEGDLWTIDAAGGAPQQVTTNPAGEYLPNWTPDGKGILYSTFRDNQWGIWVTSIEDGSDRRIASLEHGRAMVRLSPDGSEVVYHNGRIGELTLWRKRLPDGKAVRISPPGRDMGFPCWSPDGKWLAVETNEPGSSQIGVLPAGGGPVTMLTEGGGHHWPFSFAPDSDRIAYAGLEDGAWNLWTVSRTTREKKQLTSHRTLRTFVRYPAWSPKGDRIVYEFVETKGNIFAAEWTER